MLVLELNDFIIGPKDILMIFTIALIIHTLICIALVLVILSQTSKGGLDANLGGAAMNVFGGSGASQFLRKWTQILGLLFVASCLLMAFLVRDLGSADVKGIQERQKKLGETTKTPQKPDAAKQNAAQPAQPAQNATQPAASPTQPAQTPAQPAANPAQPAANTTPVTP